MATITPKEFAAKVESDGRTVRKFLRSITPADDRPGKGSRWTIEGKQVASLTKQFRKWDEDRKVAKDASDAGNEDEVLEENETE